MNSRTFLATAATWLCILPNIDAVTTSQNVENLGFGVELILAKLEQLENRIMMLEQNVNTSLEAMLKSPCSPQSGRLDVADYNPRELYPVPSFPTRKTVYNNRPMTRGDEHWSNNSSGSNYSYSYNRTVSFGSGDLPRPVRPIPPNDPFLRSFIDENIPSRG